MSIQKLSISAILVSATSFFGNTMIANADTLAGVMWGGPSQAFVLCYLFNSGPGIVNITSKTINAESGGTLPLAGDTCGTSITEGRICYFSANIPVNGGNACNVVLSPSGANVRGEMEIRTTSGVILNSGGLR